MSEILCHRRQGLTTTDSLFIRRFRRSHLDWLFLCSCRGLVWVCRLFIFFDFGFLLRRWIYSYGLHISVVGGLHLRRACAGGLR